MDGKLNLSQTKRCCNLDWLEIAVLENPDKWPMDAEFFKANGWNVQVREYGTRTFREMFTLFDCYGFPFIEIRRNPIGVLKNGETNHAYEFYGAKLRLVNRYCYVEGVAKTVNDFIVNWGYSFQRISRVDVCLDFIKFDSGDIPAKFLERYMKGRYSKINQANITAFGADTWAGRGWHSVSWGSKKSPVFTRLYCKTFELEQVKDKPYIRQAWAASGLVDNPLTCELIDESGKPYKPLVWRLEFVIASSVKRWVTIDDQMMPKQQKRSFRNTLDVYYTRQGILNTIASLAVHFFHFKHYEEGKSKYKCEDKVLFNFSDATEFYSVEKVATDVEKSTLVERLIKLLQMFNLTHYDQQANKLANQLLYDLQEFQLKNMAANPYSKDEVELLRQLLRVRMERQETTFEEAKIIAQNIMTIERSIWDNISDNPINE